MMDESRGSSSTDEFAELFRSDPYFRQSLYNSDYMDYMDEDAGTEDERRRPARRSPAQRRETEIGGSEAVIDHGSAQDPSCSGKGKA